MILVLDSYDSFVHNLARYLREAGAEVDVIRSDALEAPELLARQPAGIVLSPGPCTPSEAGVGLELVRTLLAASERGETGPRIPVLGVCLGHQVVAEACGAMLRPARPPRHGVATAIQHTGRSPLFEGIPERFPAGLYHSLSVDPDTLPSGLQVTAVDDRGEIMALEWPRRELFGVQFHPESILTPDGRTILRNFLARTGRVLDRGGRATGGSS